MPNRDGTGPDGEGPRTGRGRGNCSETRKNNNCPGCGRRGSGRGLFRRNRRD